MESLTSYLGRYHATPFQPRRYIGGSKHGQAIPTRASLVTFPVSSDITEKYTQDLPTSAPEMEVYEISDVRCNLSIGNGFYSETMMVLKDLTKARANDLITDMLKENLPGIPDRPRPVKIPTRESSMIAGIAYDRDRKILDVDYHSNGRTYRYHGVNAEVVIGLLTAESMGRYFNDCIRGVFRYERYL